MDSFRNNVDQAPAPNANIFSLLENRKTVINEKLKRCRDFKYSDPKPTSSYF